jgi:hypothetical protein
LILEFHFDREGAVMHTVKDMQIIYRLAFNWLNKWADEYISVDRDDEFWARLVRDMTEPLELEGMPEIKQKLFYQIMWANIDYIQALDREYIS